MDKIKIFTFSYNVETQEAAIAGNVSIQEASQILQGLVIADAVQRARIDMAGQKKDKSGKIKSKEVKDAR